ncbi:hypothetical protein EDC01DRAFT_671896 [Geopyxis carbonaria]|nr:hypothetical protein EDC01DRAFT_671896 [Geopyxis carbonaria]
MLKKKATATEVPMQIRKANMYRDILGGTSQFFDPAEFLPHSLAAMRLAATTYEEYTPYLWDLGRDFVVGYDQGLPRAALVPNTVTDPKALAHFDDASSLWCEDLPSTVLPTDSAMVDYVGWDAVMTNTPAGQTNPVRTLARFEAHFVYRNLLEPDEDNVRPRDVACILDSGSRNPSIRMSDYSALTENVPLPFKGLRSRIPIGGHSPVPIPYVDLEMKILDWTQPTGTLMGWRSIEVDVETDPLAKPLSGNLPWKWLYTGSVPGSHKHDLLPRFVFGQTITSLRNNMKRPGPNNTSIPHAPATQQAIGWP